MTFKFLISCLTKILHLIYNLSIYMRRKP